MHGNIGRTLSAEHRMNLSKSHRGMKFSEEHRQNISRGNKGKIMSAETRRKMSKSRKGIIFSFEHRKNLSLAHRGKRTGKDSSLWRGGITPWRRKIRNSPQYKVWRMSVFKRDNYTCQECGAKGVKLNADHTETFSSLISSLRAKVGMDNIFQEAMSYKPLWDINNGRTLCVKCHYKTDTFGYKSILINNINKAKTSP